MSDRKGRKHDFLANLRAFYGEGRLISAPLVRQHFPGIPVLIRTDPFEDSMKRLGLSAIAAAFSAAFIASPALAAPQCFELRFLDANKVVVPVNPPLVGIMIGDRPLFEGNPPNHEFMEDGSRVPCPEALLASVRKAFDDFCTTDDRRKKAAAANKVDMSVINTRCSDLTATLTK